MSPLQKVVSSSSPLIHLAKIGRLNLLKEFFDQIIVPEAVHRECVEEKHREDARKIAEAEWIVVLKVKDQKLKKALMMNLDEGEAEAIVLALEEGADLILLDDYEARTYQKLCHQSRLGRAKSSNLLSRELVVFLKKVIQLHL